MRAKFPADVKSPNIKNMSLAENTNNYPRPPYFAKLIDGRLMMCSNDIKTNDEAFSETSKVWYKLTDSYREPHPDDYKIVGFISKGADWVKEGDRFFKENIDGGWNYFLEDNLFKIKGTCGHFH